MAIINHSDVPAHLADAALLVRLMGFRKAEVFGLRVQQVDFSVRGVWLEAEQTKGGRAECVPASDEAIELLRRLVDQAREWKTDHLFTYQHGKKGERRPVKDPRRAWRTVLKKLGIKHRWHDTKASFVTAVAQVASAATTKALARHKDHRTTERYIEVADPVRRQAVEAISFGGQQPARGKSPKRESQTGAASDLDSIAGPENEKALEPLGSKAFPLHPELVGATGFEPATPRPPV
ncbi:tyrosine-type recombinase/integrase [Azospirillum doebereinerae]